MKRQGSKRKHTGEKYFYRPNQPVPPAHLRIIVDQIKKWQRQRAIRVRRTVEGLRFRHGYTYIGKYTILFD